MRMLKFEIINCGINILKVLNISNNIIPEKKSNLKDVTFSSVNRENDNLIKGGRTELPLKSEIPS